VPDGEGTLTIEVGRGERHYWRDLWRYRELLGFLAWRDVLVRYKQTVLGVLWAVLRPAVAVLILTFVFGRLAGLSSGEAPYPIFVLAGVLPWQFFSNALSESSSSLIANTNLLSKVYFPRIIAPLSAVVVCVVDFLVALALSVALMAWYGYVPGWRALALPFFFGHLLVVSFGPGLWLAALNVKYRDFRYVVPFILQFGLYVSPVGFGSDIVPSTWRLLYYLNPVAAVIDGFRWSLLRDAPMYWPGFAVSSGAAVALAVAGLTYFRSTERRFADVV
jgi:lipopolysaccharide transport system permease protein